jgi:hypothetical protein
MTRLTFTRRIAQATVAAQILSGLAALAWLVCEPERPVTRVADLVRGK